MLAVTINSSGSVFDGIYSGWRGSPERFRPSVHSRVPIRSAMRITDADLAWIAPCSPHAAMTKSDPRSAALMWRSLSGPTGSALAYRASGSVALSANRFTTSSRRYPQAQAKLTQRLIVGSSRRSSAVDGFSIMNRHVPLPSALSLVSEYLNFPQGLKVASMETDFVLWLGICASQIYSVNFGLRPHGTLRRAFHSGGEYGTG